MSEAEKNTIVKLPSYVQKLAIDLTVLVSIVQDEKTETIPIISSSNIINGDYFKVFTSNPTHFNWLVMGKRYDIQTEVEKQNVELKNIGPYTWI